MRRIASWLAATALVALLAGCSSSGTPTVTTTTIGGPPGTTGPTTCADLAALSQALTGGPTDEVTPLAIEAVRRARRSVPPAQQAALDTVAQALDEVVGLDPDDPERDAKAVAVIESPEVVTAFSVVVEYRLTVCGDGSTGSGATATTTAVTAG